MLKYAKCTIKPRFYGLGARCTRNLATSAPRWRPQPLKLLFLGGDRFSIQVLEPLLKTRGTVWDDVLVVTDGEKWMRQAGQRERVTVIPPLYEYAKSNQLPTSFLPTTGIRDWEVPPAFSNAHGLEPPPILVTASFGHIIPSKFLINHFPQPHTRLNVHPSLLPEFRGAAPIQWSIIKAADNKVETGVTVQSLEYGKGKVDCGAVWAQDASVTIDQNSTYENLLPILAHRGGLALIKVLEQIQNGTAVSVPQGECLFHASKISPETALVNCSTQSAVEIESYHRAFGHQQNVLVEIRSQLVKLLDVRLVTAPINDLPVGWARFERDPADSKSHRILFRCAPPSSTPSIGSHNTTTEGQELMLEVRNVHQANKKALGVKDYWNGLKRWVGKSDKMPVGKRSAASP